MKPVNLALAAGALWLAAGAHAAPSISIGTMYDFVLPDRSTIQKRIVNNGDSTAFVRVSVAEIVYGPDGKPREQPLDTEAVLHGRGSGLVASPGRMIIPARGQQTSRILYTGSREQERYFRVRYVPVLPDENEKAAAGEAGRIDAGVSVMTGFGGIVTVLPARAHFSTQVSRSGQNYVVRNGGNATVIVENLQSCDAAYRECGEPKTTYVLPGSSKTLGLEKSRYWRYSLVEGAGSKVVKVNTAKTGGEE